MREQLVELGVSEFNVAAGIFQLSEAEESRVTTASGDVSFSALRHIMLDLGNISIAMISYFPIFKQVSQLIKFYRSDVSNPPNFLKPSRRGY